MNRTPNLTIEDYAKLDPHFVVVIDGHEIAFSTPNKLTLWRAQTILEKEPVTIEWIGRFSKSDVLVDVGANVGMYAIIAAATHGMQVFAFEPEAQNFALLMKNILRNRLSERVTAWPVALSDEQRFGHLFVSSAIAGDSCHSFGEAVDYKLEKRHFPITQGAFSTSLDDLVASGTMPVPTHIKIDVDGFEHKVVHGARRTLSDQSVRSLLIEINPAVAEHIELIKELGALGFDFDPKQVAASRRTAGPFEGLAEYVFRR